MTFLDWVSAHNIACAKKDGGVDPLYTIGTISKYIGRSIETIRTWEKKGLIEKPRVLDSRGGRFYSVSEVDDLVAKIPYRLDRMLQGRPITRYCRVKMNDGVEVLVRLYPLSQIVKASGKSLSTIQRMEKAGSLPKTTLLGDRGSRLFSYNMIQAVREAFQEKKRGEDFTNQVLSAWKEEGFYGGVVVEILPKEF